MRDDVLELDHTVSSRAAELKLTLGDVESVRLLLAGSSVIDWHKATFDSLADVDRVLRLHRLQTSDPADRQRIRYVFNEAVAYLEEHVRVRVPPDLRNPDDVRQIFLVASDAEGFRRRQAIACMVLKLMHVLHHLEAADLKHRAAFSEQALLELAHTFVTAKAREMRASGMPLVSFYGSRKTRASVVTKLITKRENVATTVFDKLRYRLVVPKPDDLLPTLVWLLRHVFPFNHVIPGQSHNNLLDPAAIEAMLDPADRAELHAQPTEPAAHETSKNEFSGATYRMINFIADVPVRMPDEVLPRGTRLTNGRVTYVMVEFQLVDEATAIRNEQGDNAHDLYKKRQAERVETRLMRGAYVK